VIQIDALIKSVLFQPPARGSDTVDAPKDLRRWAAAGGGGGWWGVTLSMRMRTHPTSTLPERKGKRGEGRGVSDEYGVRDAACPISTGVQHGANPKP
jgi:hypothetical protein